MAEPAQAVRDLSPEEPADVEDAPVAESDFPGCRAVRISREEIEDYDGRLEYWESRTETAMVVCEPTTTYHERPGHRLAALAALIGASRGSPLAAFGTSDLVRFDADGTQYELLQADQILYLHPPPDEELAPKVDVDGDHLPDVIVEVDYSTDVRVRKLPLYEAWGFPEVWVDVPDVGSPSRPKSRRPGLSIHVLEGGRFRRAESSRAFPGWSAWEIHRALNETVMSEITREALHRVGAVLGAAEGTGPDDDPWLRHYLDEGRAAGRAEGRATGRAEGHAAGRAEAVVAVLAGRGIATTAALPARIAELGELPVEGLMQAALECESEAEFLQRCAAAAAP